MEEIKMKETEFKQSFSIPKQSGNSIFDILTIKKEKYENIDIFLANLNIPDLPKDIAKKNIGLYVYYFEVTRNKYSWKIKRCLKDFHDLFVFLSNKYKHVTIVRDFLHHISLKANYSDPNNILLYIEKSMQIILKTPALHRDLELLAFFEVSFVPLEKGTKKYKECYIWKRSGGRYKPDNIFFRCGLYCKVWSKRWLVIRQDGVLYTLGPSLDKSYIREILFFDSSFQIEYGKKYANSNLGIILTASSRKLHLKALNFLQFYDIIHSLKVACNECPYTQINRFLAFSPPRIGEAYCKCYIDAEDYYSDICEVIKRAREEIFIADWWLSPELYLKRPVGEQLNEDSRLDRILLKAAEEGVRINIIIYKEVTLALANDSLYTKKKLENLHKNIKVLRHPKDMIFLWSHHEKILIVDQEIAFLGGLDLCYGRFDTQAHRLRDVVSENNQKVDGMFPGIDYYNVRIVDFTNVRNFTQSTLNKTKDQRMPWHDIAVRIIGEPVKDLTRHFIQYWNFVTYDLLKKDHKNNYLEVTVRENKDHNKTISNLMENSFLKKEREKSNKVGIIGKIQKKFQKTKESVRKILHKSTKTPLKSPAQKKNKPVSENLFNLPSMEKEMGSEVNLSDKSVQDDESEELALSRKKVSIYLDNVLNDPAPSITLIKCSEEPVEEENISEEGLGEVKKKILEKNFTQKNTYKLQFANNEDIYYPSNSIEQINDVKDSVPKPGTTFQEMKSLSIEKKPPATPTLPSALHNPDSPGKNSNKNKKKVGYKKSVSINPIPTGYVPKIMVFAEPGKFNLEKERVFELFLENQQDNNNNNNNNKYLLSPEQGKRISRSHQNIPMKEEEGKGFMSEEKNHFRKKLEDFTSYDLDLLNPLNQNKDYQPKGESTAKIDLLKSNYYIKINKKQDLSPKTKTEKLKDFFHKNNLRLKNNLKNLKQNLKNFGSRKHTKSDELTDKNESSEDEELNQAKKSPEQYQMKNFLAPNHKRMNPANELFASKLTCSCQILRSASSWSLGLGPYQTEKSIHMAYIQMIEQSKHFIYIENQFFISNLAGPPVENLIADALLLRIKKAHALQEKFRVIVFLPLLPGFPGDIDKPSAAVLKIQLHWEYFTISRGGNSLLECLRKEEIDPDEYIHFFSLRGHDIVGGVPKTEIIYIHSKMIMVDDNICFIGSANINDRSMVGSRDSEIGVIILKFIKQKKLKKVVIEDSKKVDSTMDGKKYRASELIFHLRLNLFKEHFGLESEEFIDPLDDNLWEILKHISKKNTDIFREVFRCYPDDEITHTDEIQLFEEKKKEEKYHDLKDEIKGHVVDFPIRFLERQSLKLPIFTKEYLVPDINFV